MAELKNISEYLAMNGGNGSLSYSKNSSYQRAAVDSSKAMVKAAIADQFEVDQFTYSTPFRIADLGCSIGPNTFIAVQTIIEAVKQKYQFHGLNSKIPEFEVFFNDCASNDFNTLFSSLPPDRQYFAVGVPGSFHKRLFPKASLHFVYSSYALHWLSKLPNEILDARSPAWNKEMIHYTSASVDVIKAYSTQFSTDMEAFLNARAQEVAPGGLVALIIAVVPNKTLPSNCFIIMLYQLLSFSLMDMVNVGLVSEAKVHSFNLPIYYPSPRQLEDLVKENGCFRIENMIPMCNQMKHNITFLDYEFVILHIRAGTEQLIKEHFGSDIIDELFNRFSEKVAAKATFIFKQEHLDNFIDQFVLLKRKR